MTPKRAAPTALKNSGTGQALLTEAEKILPALLVGKHCRLCGKHGLKGKSRAGLPHGFI
jgi:hypothetical protein